jgi:SAM-dependent methyltransferase
MTLEYFDDLWTALQPDLSDQADFWNRRAPSYDAHSGEEDSSEHRRILVDKLMTKAGLGAGSRVLDIGCGPGRHALSFAERVARVEAFDISPKMIERARQNAAEAGRTNSGFQVLDWAAADLRRLNWEKTFDLVIASKTPAVNDRATLEKMMAASRGFCCLITQVDINNSIRDQLRPLVRWDEMRARISRGFICAFNLLWLLGYYPEVEYFDRAWEFDSSLEEALYIYTRYFEGFVPLDSDQKKALADKLEALSQGGTVREQVESKAALISWRI